MAADTLGNLHHALPLPAPRPDLATEVDFEVASVAEAVDSVEASVEIVASVVIVALVVAEAVLAIKGAVATGAAAVMVTVAPLQQMLLVVQAVALAATQEVGMMIAIAVMAMVEEVEEEVEVEVMVATAVASLAATASLLLPGSADTTTGIDAAMITTAALASGITRTATTTQDNGGDTERGLFALDTSPNMYYCQLSRFVGGYSNASSFFVGFPATDLISW